MQPTITYPCTYLRVLMAAVAVMIAATAAEARKASDFFVSAPDRIVALITPNTRLDMVDYFNFGSDRASSNIMGGEARIKRLSDRIVEWTPANDVNIQLALLTAGTDTVVAVVTTVHAPMADSSIEFFTTDWDDVNDPPFLMPAYADGLSPEGTAHEAELKLKLPFMPVSAMLNDDTTVLTLTNEAPYYLSEEDYADVSSMLTGSKVYSIDGLTIKPRE